MSLLLGLDLQPVFDAPEKTIGCIERDYFFVRQEFDLRQFAQSLKRARLLQKGVARAVNQLQRLNNEFDFANPAGAEFDVAVQIFVADNFAFDPPLQRGDFIQQIRRRTFRINERLVLLQEFVDQLFAPGDPARTNQREPFPRFAEASIIVFHALE